MRRIVSHFVQLLSLLHTRFVSFRHGIEIGANTVLYYKSSINCLPNSYKEHGGGDNWEKLSNRGSLEKLSRRHAFPYRIVM